MGRVEKGIEVLAEALASMEKTGERYYEDELYRLKGELLLNAERGMRNAERKTKKKNRAFSPIHSSSFSVHCSAAVEAEACFSQAIEIAQRQQAKSWELRASTSLARLWQSQALEQGAGSREQESERREQAPRNTKHATSSPRLTNCCLKSTTGSPKGLIRRICKMRRRF